MTGQPITVNVNVQGGDCGNGGTDPSGCDACARIEALETRVTALEGGGGGPVDPPVDPGKLPTEVAGNVLWMTRNDPATLIIGGTQDRISIWKDKSQFTNDGVAGNAGNEPLLAEKTVEFDGTDQLPLTRRIDLPNGYSVGFVYRSDQLTGNQAVLGDTSGSLYNDISVNDGLVTVRAYNGSAFDVVQGSALINDGALHYVTVTHGTDGTVVIRVNGVEDASGNAAYVTSRIEFSDIGATYNTSPGIIGLAELFIHDGVNAPGDVLELENHMKAEHSL